VFKRWWFLAVFSLALSACQAQEPVTLKIAAAADLQPLLPGIIAQFERESHAKAEAAYASSATLATQILNGAPFGLFLSADMSFPEKVVAAGLADSAKPIPYARGTLVLWARNDSPAQPVQVDSLRRKTVRTVAVANAEHAPYGRAAAAALEKLGFMNEVKDKLVVAENIGQAAQFADSGNAEAGLISLTSALTPRLQEDGKYVEMPAGSYPPIVQGAVAIKGPTAAVAHQFIDFLQSAPIRAQLAERGLRAP
jgi:molybdate transport system substrate-binding protein